MKIINTLSKAVVRNFTHTRCASTEARALNLAYVGAGRLGRYHAAAAMLHPNVNIRYVLDSDQSTLDKWSRDYPDLQHGRHQCKFVSDMNGLQKVCDDSRRFDPHYARAFKLVSSGYIQSVRLITATLRDPGDLMDAFIQSLHSATLGNLIVDYTIHDIDSCVLLIGEKPKSVYAVCHAHHKEIAARKDWDTVSITLYFPSGAIAFLTTIRDCAYGYDQRFEILGTNGKMITVNNPRATEVSTFDECGERTDRVGGPTPGSGYLDRYKDAYANATKHFIQLLQGIDKPLVTREQVVLGAQIAQAANESYKTGKVVYM